MLPFRVDYIRTLRPEDEIKQESVPAIDQEKILMDSRRISYISQYILEHFAQKTKRNEQHYDFNKLSNISSVAKAKKEVEEVKVKTKLQGFNSIFAVASIPFVKLYYTELKRQMEELPENQRLKIATIYSYSANEAEEDFGCDENSENTDGLDESSRDFLEKCISDYNAMFGTSYDTSSEKFQNYYKDVSLRMKNREIDLLIVVNMFLTGFDATTLNTLWVDKNLRMHGLIQAYSRTNRILNSIKNFGNIVCFRNLEPATNAALELFGDKEAGGLVLIKTFDEYYNGYENKDGTETIGYKPLVESVIEDFPLEKGIEGEKAEKDFIKRWGTILRYRNILQSFDQFKGKEILNDDQYKDYQGLYLDLYEKYRRQEKGEAVNVNDDIVFEIELVKSVEINIDYILFLVSQKNGDSVHDAQLEVKIKKSIGATPDLRDKEDLIMQFVQTTSAGSDINDEWAVYVRQKLGKELQELISTENLKPEETVEFLQQSFRDGEIRESGTGIARILPPMPLFGAGGSREAKKRTVTEKLKALFKRFYDLCGGVFPFLGVNPPEIDVNKQEAKEPRSSSFLNYLNEINL
ncbi:MAG: UvrB domain 3-containing protein [Muribaculaceae bacterium]